VRCERPAEGDERRDDDERPERVAIPEPVRSMDYGRQNEHVLTGDAKLLR
jgi:hypothetical protein